MFNTPACLCISHRGPEFQKPDITVLFLFNVVFFGGMMVLFCGYWNCSPLFKVSLHKHCRADNLSPIYKPSTIPWSIFHPLIYIHITIIIGSEYSTDGAFIGTLGFGLFSLGIREFPISVSGDSYFIYWDSGLQCFYVREFSM